MIESMTGNFWDGAALILFLAVCLAGGWLLVRAGFRLPPADHVVVGAALGLSLVVWLANALSRWIASPLSFWISALIPLVVGLALFSRTGNREESRSRSRQPWLMLAAVLALAYLFFRIGRGVAIFDDRKNLSMISILAAGDIPPHFYMNADFFFPYHYAFQLLGGLLMRVGGLFPWTAFDLAKGIAGSLAVGLSVVWGRRATGRWIGGAALGTIMLLASGARWLLLLLPTQLVSQASQKVVLWGSAAQTAPDLVHALTSAWVVEGGPPFPLPFAFVNGILQPLILNLQAGPVSFGLIVLLLVLILYPARLRKWSWGIIAVLLALWALAAEAEFVLFAAGLAGACAVMLLRRKKDREGGEVASILAVLATASAAALVQGGTLTEVARRWLTDEAGAGTNAAGFSLRTAPAIVSSHLGELRLLHAGELLIGLFELGIPLLLLPIAIWVALRAARRGRILALALGIGALLGFVIPIFIRYDVDRDITRLTHFALVGWILLGTAPLAAAWRVGGRRRRAAIAGMAGVLVFGGIVVTGSLLTALPRSVFSNEIAPVDAAMARQVWNRLAPGSLVIDSDSWRAVAVTGRLTRSAQDSSTLLGSWEQLVADPSVGRLAAAGFDYAYVDQLWWGNMPRDAQRSFRDPCVQLVASQDDDGANGDRWLYDLRACPAE